MAQAGEPDEADVPERSPRPGPAGDEPADPLAGPSRRGGGARRGAAAVALLIGAATAGIFTVPALLQAEAPPRLIAFVSPDGSVTVQVASRRQREVAFRVRGLRGIRRPYRTGTFLASASGAVFSLPRTSCSTPVLITVHFAALKRTLSQTLPADRAEGVRCLLSRTASGSRAKSPRATDGAGLRRRPTERLARAAPHNGGKHHIRAVRVR